jgi:hypothetical protein
VARGKNGHAALAFNILIKQQESFLIKSLAILPQNFVQIIKFLWHRRVIEGLILCLLDFPLYIPAKHNLTPLGWRHDRFGPLLQEVAGLELGVFCGHLNNLPLLLFDKAQGWIGHLVVLPGGDSHVVLGCCLARTGRVQLGPLSGANPECSLPLAPNHCLFIVERVLEQRRSTLLGEAENTFFQLSNNRKGICHPHP